MIASLLRRAHLQEEAEEGRDEDPSVVHCGLVLEVDAFRVHHLRIKLAALMHVMHGFFRTRAGAREPGRAEVGRVRRKEDLQHRVAEVRRGICPTKVVWTGVA